MRATKQKKAQTHQPTNRQINKLSTQNTNILSFVYNSIFIVRLHSFRLLSLSFCINCSPNGVKIMNLNLVDGYCGARKHNIHPYLYLFSRCIALYSQFDNPKRCCMCQIVIDVSCLFYSILFGMLCVLPPRKKENAQCLYVWAVYSISLFVGFRFYSCLLHFVQFYWEFT